MSATKISIILPIHNEEHSLSELFSSLNKVAQNHNLDFEIIAVDDGSTDESLSLLREFAQLDKRIVVVSLLRNYGQTAALSAGISKAQGDVIIPMDADLENDPFDIPKLLQELERGSHVVSGWRKNRWADHFLTRRLPSRVANSIISWISGVHLHDYGCTLKAYQSHVIADLHLYGEMHRFIPAYAAWQGAKVSEIVVNYTPRKFGTTHYNFSRTFRVVLDLLLLRFLTKYMDRPIQFFGGIGMIVLAIGVLSGTAAIILRLWYDLHLVQTPLPVFSALFVIIGVNMMILGILAEMIMRIYFEAQHKVPYKIRETIFKK